jgi:glycine/D-amino acid oxidase-like deaminating enzyme
MAKTYDVVVVGCGILGAATAYHLKKKGVERVLVIEREQPAAGGTGKSAALVRQHYSTRLMARLARAGVDIFSRMHQELGKSGGFVQSGWTFLVPPSALAAAEANIAMQRTVDVKTRLLSKDEIAAKMPWLNTDGVAGVVFEDEAGYADPVASTEAYVYAFEKLGGEVRRKTACRSLRRVDSRVIGISLDDEDIDAGAVVNAAGPWSTNLAKYAGIELQMRSIREQDTVWEVAGGRPIPECGISNAVDATYVRPLGNRRFVLGRGFPKDYAECDPDNYKHTADDAFIAEVHARTELRFPPFQGAKLITAYSALYDVTPDWYPFVGPRSGLAGYYDASGGSGHGFKISPAMGRELADWIVDGKVAPDFARLSYDRVTKGDLFQQAYGGNRG